MNKMFSRGLALAMAGMMAVTAVPAMPAIAADNDGLSTTTGIDSIKGTNKGCTTYAGKTGDSNEISLWLKEHDDVSSNNTDVGAFRISSDNGDFLRITSKDAHWDNNPATLLSGGQVTVENVKEQRDTGNNFKTAGGVNIKLVAGDWSDTDSEKSRTVKVTIDSLADINSSKALDTTVLTVSISGKDESIKVTKSSISLAEGKTTTFGAETVNTKDIVTHKLTVDNTSVVKITGVVGSGAGVVTDNKTATVAPVNATKSGSTTTILAGQAGNAEITVEGLDDKNKVIDTKTVAVNVTTNNGRLSINFVGKDDKTKNFTDDKSVSSDKVITHLYSANVEADDFAEFLNAVTTGSSVTDANVAGVRDLSDPVGANVVTAGGVTTDYNRAPNYKTDRDAYIALNMQDKKTAQVTASSAINDNVSFKLLAVEDKKTEFDNDNSANEKIAAKYASISKDGAITAKKAFPADGRMFVAVYVAKQDETDKTNERGASAYFIPLTISEQGGIKLYVSDSRNVVDIESGGATNTSERLYLSMKDRTTDTLYIDCNAGAAYVEGSSSDSNVVTYKNGVITALKEGTATITVKTTSAPEYAGIAEVKIPVTVNSLESDATITVEGATISRDVPSANLVAKGSADNNIVFDTDLYKKSATRPSGYEVIKEEKDGADDVRVTSAGRVSYQQNNGVVYVRAQGKISGTKNPTPYVYAAVAYGEGKVDSDLTVANTSVSVKVGATAQINANASGVISYKSSDEAVATVDAAGVVTGVSEGTATITVDASATEKMNAGTKTVTVTVTKAATTKKANTIKVTPTKKTYKVKAVKKAKKTFTIKATKAKGTVSYSVAKKVKKAGITVTKKGKVTVKKGTKKGTYKITVKAKGNTSYKAATKTVKVVIK